MKKTLLILLALVWIVALVVLIIALSNQNSANPFKEYRLIIGIGFIALTGFIRIVHKRLYIRK
jgi:uncharacterized protein YpmS